MALIGGLAALCIAPAAYASAEESVQKLLDAGEFDKAQKRCDGANAELDNATPALRELCAKAWFPYAEALDTPAEWLKYQQTWHGTALEKEARNREAAAALARLGGTGTEDQYGGFVNAYGDTPSGVVAQQYMGDAAIRDATTAAEAKRIATQFPNHPQLSKLVENFLADFAQITIEGDQLEVSLVPKVNLDEPVRASWVVLGADGQYEPWSSFAQRLLVDLGVPDATLQRLKRPGAEPYPACALVGTTGLLGVRLQLGNGTAFVPKNGNPTCGVDAVPTFFQTRGGRITQIFPAPGVTLALAPPDAEDYQIGDGAFETRVFNPLETGDPMLVSTVIGQRAGSSAWLVTPVAGGRVPFYTRTAPPPTGIPLPANLRSVQVSDSWSLMAGSRRINAGEPSGEAVHVTGPGTTQSWTLPGGENKVMSPLFATLIGFNKYNATFQRPPPQPVAPATQWSGGISPIGSTLGPAISQLPPTEVDALTDQLGQYGLKVEVTAAWRADLHFVQGEATGPETAFEAKSGSLALQGMIDLSGRVFVWERGTDPAGTETVTTFRVGNTPYLTWTVVSPEGLRTADVIHFDDIGLIHETR